MRRVMKIRERILIFCGLALFLFVVSYAFLQEGKAKKIPTPVAESASEQCVESREYMRANHMLLLDDWRHGAVREGERIHVTPDGRKFEKNLSTCFQCHGSRGFCVRCHTYASAKPNCFSCHHEM